MLESGAPAWGTRAEGCCAHDPHVRGVPQEAAMVMHLAGEDAGYDVAGKAKVRWWDGQ